MHKIVSILAVSALSLALAACGGSNDKAFVGTGSSSSTSSSSGTGVAVAALTATSDTATMPSDGSQSANITALARDANNQLVQGVTVAFSASSGGIAVTQATTDANGAATAVLSTAGDPSLRTITVTATAGGKSATVQVQVVSGGSSGSTQMGNGSGASFQANVIGIGAASISAGGSTGLQVSIVDQSGTLYTATPVTVTFNSPCVAAGQASITAAGGAAGAQPGQVTTSTGLVSATYTATGCSGSDLITATATVGTTSLSAQGTVTVAAASVGSIQFVSATPTEIGLKGTGLPETSTVVFKVTDSSGGPRPNVTVTFALDTSVGGLSFSPTSAVSAADGTVETVVSSGTVHTVVRVTANVASPALSTQSSQLTVTTGLPASRGFSIAVGGPTYPPGYSPVKNACSNVEAWSVDGVSVPFTVSLADRYNNPVPGGTAVTFYTNGGHVVGSCSTPALTGTSADGTCSVLWTSSNPRPQTTDTPPVFKNGRGQIFATVIGEESFTDSNANGFWDVGEVFDDLGEPYLDADENQDNLGYQVGDHFLDFNNNGVRDGPSGNFVGITCNGSVAGSTCTTSTLALGVTHLIIMSTSAANISYQSVAGGFSGTVSALTIAHAATGTVTFNVQDLNGNSMAAGTTIGASADSAIGNATISASSFSTVGCDETVGGQNYTVSFTAVASLPSMQSSVSGNLTLSVVSPSGSATKVSIPVTVD